MFMYFLLVTGVGVEGNECRLLNSEIPCLMPSLFRLGSIVNLNIVPPIKTFLITLLNQPIFPIDIIS
jgi:hypothetical protein